MLKPIFLNKWKRRRGLFVNLESGLLEAFFFEFSHLEDFNFVILGFSCDFLWGWFVSVFLLVPARSPDLLVGLHFTCRVGGPDRHKIAINIILSLIPFLIPVLCFTLNSPFKSSWMFWCFSSNKFTVANLPVPSWVVLLSYISREKNDLPYVSSELYGLFMMVKETLSFFCRIMSMGTLWVFLINCQWGR